MKEDFSPGIKVEKVCDWYNEILYNTTLHIFHYHIIIHRMLLTHDLTNRYIDQGDYTNRYID